MILLSSYDDPFTLHIVNKERSLEKLDRLFTKIFYDVERENIIFRLYDYIKSRNYNITFKIFLFRSEFFILYVDKFLFTFCKIFLQRNV